MPRPDLLTATDVALLVALGERRSVVAASRTVGISRDRAVYRIARLEHAFGGPVVESERGGRGHGESRLTELGDRLAREGFGSVELWDARPVAAPPPPNRLEGEYHPSPQPSVDVGGRLRFRVAFPASDGERVRMVLDPEAILVARRRFPSSARNVLQGRVEAVHRASSGSTLFVRTGPVLLRVAVTDEPVRQLRLRPGARVWLYVKATALRRVGRAPRPTRGSPRS
jgi:molybdate transport system regulatory protein